VSALRAIYVPTYGCTVFGWVQERIKVLLKKEKLQKLNQILTFSKSVNAFVVPP
jgi:hypothetical protein